MSEIQILANPELVKYLVGGCGGLIVIINALIGYIFSLIKKDIEKIKDRQRADHDRLDKLFSEHKIFHKTETGINS